MTDSFCIGNVRVSLALGFRMLYLWVYKLTGRGDGGFVGAQASGIARALR